VANCCRTEACHGVSISNLTCVKLNWERTIAALAEFACARQ